LDIKWKSYSHSLLAKTIVFMIVISCFTGTITVFLDNAVVKEMDLEPLIKGSYYKSDKFGSDLLGASVIARNIISIYRNEDSEDYTEEQITDGENVAEVEIRNRIDDINSMLESLKDIKGLKYYISYGENILTNSDNTNKTSFKNDPAYILIDREGINIYPIEITKNEYYSWFMSNFYEVQERNGTVYISFTEQYLKPVLEKWDEDKEAVTNQFYKFLGFFAGLLLSFVYLIIIIGRSSFKDKEIHFNSLDRLYTDLNIILCIGLIISWFSIIEFIFNRDLYFAIIPATAIIGSLGLLLVLSLAKHIKNKTLIKHTLIYTVIYKIFRFIKDVYESGTTATKIVLIVVGYPILVALSLFLFPVTIGVAAHLALKRVKEFNAIKEGVKRVREGDLNYKIDVEGNGEFGKLASDINAITEGLHKAVENELKSERLKTELITNVSHDIRTPLTSIITYVDLLKNEKDPEKTKEYIGVLEQKAQRLKTLTDDLFEAAKASSRSIPVNFEKINIVSLITQGLGELDDKIQELELDFKINKPIDEIFIRADGNLLWRVIENLLSNIFKYALKGSRVYVNIEDLDNEVSLVMKNISAYELNISPDELMERFKRGDESRNSPGSGLGLSIAKSLVEIQNGSFNIEIDGDLFKAIIRFPKYPQEAVE